MSDWRPGLMKPEDMTVNVLTYIGSVSRRILKVPHLLNPYSRMREPIHQNVVFIRGLGPVTEKLKANIKRRLIANGMDPDSPIHDVTTIWNSGPVVELAVRVEDDFEIDGLEIWNPPQEIQEPVEVKPKKQLSGIVSGSLDGIRARFGKEEDNE